MIIKLISCALGLTLGLILTRLFDQHELHKLKEQVIELEEDNTKVIKDNSRLVAENKQLKSQLTLLLQTPPSSSNIPKFDD